jgi:DNA repair photolyase
MNLYKGCCHGCIYCDSRSECYNIDDFDIVRAKENALKILRDELRRKVCSGVIGTGAMSDPYNPFEAEANLTRNALELINAYEFGSVVLSKSALIARDIDIFKSIAEHSPMLCIMTITTADDALCRKIEPNVSISSEGFEALAKMSQAGIFTAIALMPVLPFIEDSEANIINIVRTAKECGVKFIYPAFAVTLRNNQREYFLDKLEEIFPDEKLKEKYMKQFGASYQCGCRDYKRLYAKFIKECEKSGIVYEMRSIITTYKMPYGDTQLKFF